MRGAGEPNTRQHVEVVGSPPVPQCARFQLPCPNTRASTSARSSGLLVCVSGPAGAIHLASRGNRSSGQGGQLLRRLYRALLLSGRSLLRDVAVRVRDRSNSKARTARAARAPPSRHLYLVPRSHRWDHVKRVQLLGIGDDRLQVSNQLCACGDRCPHARLGDKVDLHDAASASVRWVTSVALMTPCL